MRKHITLVFTLMLCKGILFSNSANATDYYVDPSSNASYEDGSINAPWQSINSVNNNVWRFTGGDNIYFKRGQSFKGSLVIYQGGSDAAHPVTYSSYGTDSNMPLFQYDLNTSVSSVNRSIINISNSQYVVIDGINFTDPTMDAYNHGILAHVANAINVSSSSNITMKNLSISSLGTGIVIIGNNNTVSNCTMKNMHMIVSTSSTSSDDYGAVGISLSGSNNTITNNTIRDCWGNSVKYTYDGGTIEFIGTCSNNKIMYNTFINNLGFIEFGKGMSSSGSANNNNVVAYNLMINLGRIFWINYGSSVGVSLNNLQFHNNDVIENVKSRSGSPNLIGAGPGDPNTGNMINMKNNIFWINTGVNLAKANLGDGEIVHANNVYNLGSGVLGFNIASTEKMIDDKTPMFADQSSADATAWDYSLASSSPAVDNGVNLSYTADFKGDKVYAGSAPDMGILERNSSTTSNSSSDNASTSSDNTSAAPGNSQQLAFYSFTGYSNNGNNYLQWGTSKGNVDYYNVDRSNDGSYFYRVGQTRPQDNGNYTFFDGAPSNNLQYYRISAVLNGTVINQTNIISFYNPSLISQGIAVSPNPVVSTATVTLSSDNFSNKGIMVTNTFGQPMMKQSINQDVNQVSVNLSTLSTGTYYMNVIDQNGVVLYKYTFVKN